MRRGQPVSFYTTELPQYALIELARGLGVDVIHVAGAMTYTLLVLAAAYLARGRATGGEGMARALLAAGIMLAPQLGPGTQDPRVAARGESARRAAVKMVCAGLAACDRFTARLADGI
jgi:hypothetical protein